MSTTIYPHTHLPSFSNVTFLNSFLKVRLGLGDSCMYRLVHRHALIPQLILRQRYLAQQAFVRLGTIVKPDETETEGGEGVCAERDEEPPGELDERGISSGRDRVELTYDG